MTTLREYIQIEGELLKANLRFSMADFLKEHLHLTDEELREVEEAVANEETPEENEQ